MSPLEPVRQASAYLLYSSMERVAMKAPERVGKLAFSAYGWVTFHGLPKLRRTVASNLAPVLGRPPESMLVQAATREAFSLYARYWYDTFRLRTMSKEEIDRRFSLDGRERIDRELEAGRGAILALPHIGNWDAAGRFFTANGYRLAAVAEELSAKRVFQLFMAHRRELGMRIVPLTREANVARELAKLLQENWLVALLADRDLSGRGVEVEMFGRKLRLPAGPALLSLSTGSPILVCSIHTTEEGWHCRIGEPLSAPRSGQLRRDVEDLTRLLAAEFERVIASRPADWHMFQPAWEDHRPALSGGAP